MTTLITTHENADLDALASTVAVRKLHPEAIVGFGRRLNPSTRAFLALHRGRFPSEHCDHVDLDAVDALILTDVRRRGRVPHVASLLARRDADPTALRVEVWDHHEASTDDLPADAIHVAPLGAVTTLLVETLRERGLPVDPIEATLFALGIHDDTGSLSFPTSTPRDARALAWLMEQGAELTVVKRYLAPPLDERQRQLLRPAPKFRILELQTERRRPHLPHQRTAQQQGRILDPTRGQLLLGKRGGRSPGDPQQKHRLD